MMFIETAQVLTADTAGHSRDMIHIRTIHHSTHGGRDITTCKFILAMLIPQLAEIKDRTQRIA